MSNAHSLQDTPIHLEGGVATTMIGFDGSPAWFERFIAEHPQPTFLVTSFSFSESWDAWEMHPKGSEVVLCVEGEMTLHQELPTGERQEVQLAPGQYAVNQPGTWHTADADGPVTGVFITAGEGTTHRPR